jgi:alpha-D-ribose 1-methylphosphonate 5-triphosphate synthase subunit PhnL
MNTVLSGISGLNKKEFTTGWRKIRNEESAGTLQVLHLGSLMHRVKEERNIVHTIKRRKVNWIGHILRRNCLLKHVIEGKLEGRIEMTGRRGRRRTQLLDNLKEKIRYWKLKEEALDRTLLRTRFGTGYGPVVRQTAE